MLYNERLSVPAHWWLVALLLDLSAWWAFYVALPWWLTLTLSLLTLALTAAALLWFGSARVWVTAEQFRAGRAHIALPHLGAAISLDSPQTRRLATVEADARAWLVLRPWLPRAVRVDVVDPSDPTPYWLVSSRNPDALAQALNDARVGISG